MTKTWLITGCSTGFGRHLALAVLARGDNAVVTARTPSDVQDIVANHKQTSIVHQLDVTKPADIAGTVEHAVKAFGRIDVLVNNAGIGYFGSIEESDDNEVRRMFEINVFGLAHMTQSVLPIMRRQRSGHIVNISSIGGLRAFPAVGFYNATKFAVEGLSEALALEVAPLGIHVTIVEPSGFRTDWAGRSANEAPGTIEDYRGTADKNRDSIRGYSGNQPGDPERAAQAILAAVDAEHPPLHLLLGKAAWKGAQMKLELLRQNFDAWRDTTEGADFPEGQ